MEPIKRLGENLAAESEAYGFSLATWGVGALLIGNFGVPGVGGVLAYVLGAVAGFAALALLAFGLPPGTADVSGSPLAVASVIHIAATVGTLLLCEALIRLTTGVGPPAATFALAGFVMTASYNLLLTLETVAARLVA
jgi:hypothetical protein